MADVDDSGIRARKPRALFLLARFGVDGVAATLECWAHFGPKARALGVAFLLSMCFGAVYLDHHWMLDVLAGLLCCTIVVAASRLVSARWSAT